MAFVQDQWGRAANHGKWFALVSFVLLCLSWLALGSNDMSWYLIITTVGLLIGFIGIVAAFWSAERRGEVAPIVIRKRRII